MFVTSLVNQRSDVVVFYEVARGVARDTNRIEHDVAAVGRGLAHQVRGLECTEGDGHICPHGTAVEGTGVGVDTRWQIDGEHGNAVGDPRGHGGTRAPKTEGRVDVEINPPNLLGLIRNFDQFDLGPARPQVLTGQSSVGAVEARSDYDGDPAAVGRAEHGRGHVTNGHAGPCQDGLLTGLGNGGRVGETHLTRRQDGNHVRPITTAPAVRSVCDSETCQVRIPFAAANAWAVPDTTSTGAPLSRR